MTRKYRHLVLSIVIVTILLVSVKLGAQKLPVS